MPPQLVRVPTLRAAIEACGATLLHINLHTFTDGGGVSGVAVLAETLDGGIRGARTLAAVTKMTPLVAIPNIVTRKDEAVRKRNIKFILIAIAIFGIGCVVAVHFFYKPLDLLWYIVLRKLNLA